ncbi:hypothetical protein PanWU01x14_080560, partial [Parasponia andersonii]
VLSTGSMSAWPACMVDVCGQYYACARPKHYEWRPTHTSGVGPCRVSWLARPTAGDLSNT